VIKREADKVPVLHLALAEPYNVIGVQTPRFGHSEQALT
jgi:hypothetical protein